VITKADGDNVKHATEAQAEYQHALHLFPSSNSGWSPKVLTSSSLTKKGIAETWEMITKYKDQTTKSGFFNDNRSNQNASWLHEYFQHLLMVDFQGFTDVQKEMVDLEKQIKDNTISVHAAGKKLLSFYRNVLRKHP
jgi:LAO/AO transport system kinase